MDTVRPFGAGNSARWWEHCIDRQLAGVFEGGGAKGIAYVGALEAVLERKCWFSAAAGASAGAITATLIAAGLTPRQIREESLKTLELFSDFSPFTALLRLWFQGQALPDTNLRKWLNGILRKQVVALGRKLDPCPLCTTPGAGDTDPREPLLKQFAESIRREKIECHYCFDSRIAPVTFAKLHEASEIELDVVAADLCRQQIIVFNHVLSPECQVEEAVIASAAIPFVFRDARLTTLSAGAARNYHMIVDGGVASNFPMFVFTEATFRENSTRAKYDEVIGFLLDESGPDTDDLTRARFIPRAWWQDWGGIPALRPPERQGRSTEMGLAKRFGTALALAVTEPIALLARLGRILGKGSLPQRWSRPKSRVLHNVADILDGASAVLGPILLGTAVAYVLVKGGVLVASQELWPTLVDGSMLDNLTTKVVTVVALIGAALTIVLLPIVLLVNALLSDTARWIGPGLVSTYFAGPGAPPWSRDSKRVVAIKIPEGIGALSFKLAKPEIQELWNEARKKTHDKLNLLGMTSLLSSDTARDLIGSDSASSTER